MKVFIIFGSEGNYEDYYEWVENVYIDEEKANVKLFNLNEDLHEAQDFQNKHMGEMIENDTFDDYLYEQHDYKMKVYEVTE